MKKLFYIRIIPIFLTFVLMFTVFSVFATTKDKLYHSKKHEFFVSFPVVPDVRNAHLEIEGIDATMTSYQSVTNDTIYYVTINNFSKSFNSKEAREAYVGGFLKGATLLQDDVSMIYHIDTAFKGYKAKSYKYKFKHKGVNFIQKGYYFFRNGTEHIKISMTCHENNEKTVDEKYKEFLSSLELSTTKTYDFNSNKFSINIPYSWAKRIPKNEGVLAVYGHLGYGENVNIVVSNIPQNTTIDNVSWKEFFSSPIFNSAKIQSQGYGSLGNIKTKYCIYAWETKTTKYSLKYLACVIVNKGRIYCLTFSDSDSTFELNYPTFQNIIKSIRFHD